jgi:hypothetical protein
LNLLLVIVLVAAIVFAALAGRLAAGRGRSQPAWTLFGAILGPIALIVLLASPPGRCPTCGMRTRGWPSACASCGQPFGNPPSTAPEPAMPSGRAPAGPSIAVAASVLPDVVVRGMASRPLAADPPAGVAPTASGPPPPGPTAVTRPTLVLPPHPSSTAPRRRRVGASADRLGPDATVVATGVFITGTAPIRTGVSVLKIGERYGIARTAEEIQILGPVYVDPERIIARVPAAGAVASVEGDRLVMVWPSDGGATLAFSAIASAAGIDPAARLTARAPLADAADGS